METGDDAAVDGDSGDIPAETPLRTLGTVSILGDTPPNNLVVDPNFTPPASGLDVITDGWMFRDLGGQPPQVRLLYLPDSPTRQPVVLLPGEAVNAQSAGALGEVRGLAEPLSASIWIGRNEADLVDAPVVVADLAGFDPGLGRDVSWTLEPQADETRTIAGIHWQRYAVDIAQGPIGYAALVVGDLSGRDLYLTGPVVVASDGASSERVGSRLTAVGAPVDERVQQLLRYRRESRRSP